MRVKDADFIPMILVGTINSIKFVYIVGNKTDLEANRQVSPIEGKELAKSFFCPFSGKMIVKIQSELF